MWRRLAALMMSMSLTLLAVVLVSQVVSADAGQAAKTTTVEAQTFIVRDQNGAVLASLGLSEKAGSGRETVALKLFDRQGTERASMMLDVLGDPYFILSDKTCSSRVALSLCVDGSGQFDLFGPNGEPVIALRACEAAPGMLILRHGEPRVSISAIGDIESLATGGDPTTSQPAGRFKERGTLSLYGPRGAPVWRAPQASSDPP